jgi:hypothetical protein
MTTDDLRTALEAVIQNDDLPHVERLSLAAAIVSGALRLESLEATLVGGGAIEFYSPGSYTTSDIDLVVERTGYVPKLEAALDRTLTSLGLHQVGRHWTRGDLFIEVPGTTVIDPTATFAIGPYVLRVLRKEIVLGERIVGFKHWRYTAYGAQALDMLAAFEDDLDEDILVRYLEREGAVDAYRALQALAGSEVSIDEAVLQAELRRLQVSRTPENT